MSKEFDKQQEEAFKNYLQREVNKTVECPLHDQSVNECGDPVCEIVAEAKQEFPHEKFDMYARDINDYSWLQEFVPGLIIYSAGGFYPFQAQGYLNDMPFYFRAEDGYASLNVSDSEENMFPLSSVLYSSRIDTSMYSDRIDELQQRWIDYLLTCIDRLEKTPFLYEFESNAIDYDSETGEYGLDVERDANGNIVHSEFGEVAWGHTIDEAFEKVSKNRSSYEVFCVNRCDDLKEEYPDEWQRAENKKWSKEKFAHYIKLVNVRPIVKRIEGLDRHYPDYDSDFSVKVPESWRKYDRKMIEVPLMKDNEK